MIIRNQKESAILRECGRRLAAVLEEVKKNICSGVSTKTLDDLAERLIREAGGDPIFKGYRAIKSDRPYPCSLCVSINDEVVHAIPSEKRILQEGDVVGLDVGMRWPSLGRHSGLRPYVAKGYAGGALAQRAGRDGDTHPSAGLITDMAVTVGVGRISNKAKFLIDTTRESLERGIAFLRPGIHLGDLGAVIQAHIEKSGYGVIRDLAGHGVGRELHEEPFVPNYGKKGAGPVVLEGMVLAIEPMVVEGDWHVVLDKDGWTFRTRDGGLAAHFEHTVIVTKDGSEVLTRM